MKKPLKLTKQREGSIIPTLRKARVRKCMISSIEAQNTRGERPDFGPTQVRHPDEIKTGGNYIVHATNPKGSPYSYNIQVYFKPPPDGCKGQESILVRREIPGIPRGMVIPRDRDRERTVFVPEWLFLSSLGIVPIEDGSWSQKSWLEDQRKAETA